MWLNCNIEQRKQMQNYVKLQLDKHMSMMVEQTIWWSVLTVKCFYILVFIEIWDMYLLIFLLIAFLALLYHKALSEELNGLKNRFLQF